MVKAISGKEKKVKEYLESEISRLNLQDRIFQVLIPTEKYFEVRNGKKVSKERNYLPGYVLVDGNKFPPIDIAGETVVKGDATSASIAAAAPA